MQHSFSALGTTWWITVFDERPAAELREAVTGAEALIHRFEAKYSRFKADSLIGRLNEVGQLTTDDPELRSLLAYGKQLYLKTNTHFNFLTGHVQEARGYDASYRFTPASQIPNPGNPITDLQIDDSIIWVTNSKVDLGGFGKGYVIDQVSAYLQEECQLHYFLINGGGDMRATSRQGEPITIYLEHPTKAQHYLGQTTLYEQAFASSSPFKRVWQAEEGTYTHILTSGDAPPVASYLKAPQAAWADAVATTALLATEAELQGLCASEPGTTLARFDPATNRFWSQSDFHFEPAKATTTQ